MALPSFLKRKEPVAKATVPPVAGADAQLARTRARQRLIGAAVLLVVGVVAFPLLFETQPRPIPVDIPIVGATRDTALPVPANARPAKTVVVPPLVEPQATEPAAPPASVTIAAAPPPEPVASAPASQPVPATRAPAATASQAPVVFPPKPASAPVPAASAVSADAKSGRFVVQVGAFADPAAVRDVRQKVERLGLKTYTQQVDTDGGKRTRVRVGPFDTREEAAKVLAKLKGAKLPGAVLNL